MGIKGGFAGFLRAITVISLVLLTTVSKQKKITSEGINQDLCAHFLEVPEFFHQSAGRTRKCVGKSKLFSYTRRKIFYLCQNNEHFKKHVQENFLRIADNSKIRRTHAGKLPSMKNTCRKTSYMCHIKWKYEEHMQENFLHVSYKVEV